LHLALFQILQTRSIYASVFAEKISYVSPLHHVTGIEDCLNDQFAQRFLQTSFTFFMASCETGMQFGACIFGYPDIQHHVENCELSELISLAQHLAITALLGFFLGFCSHRRSSFTTCQHLHVSHDPRKLSSSTFLLESAYRVVGQNLSRVPHCNHQIVANCVIDCPADSSSVTSSGRETLGACESTYFFQRITALLHIKCCPTFRFPASFDVIMMTLASYLFLCPITNAQSCDQLMLGMERSNLSAATLPMGLIFFAGGFKGASS
jgi:hypothetical protein